MCGVAVAQTPEGIVKEFRRVTAHASGKERAFKMICEYIAADVLAAIESVVLVPQRTGIASSEYIRLKVNGKTQSLTFTLSSEIRSEHRIAPHKADGGDEWQFFVERGLFVPFINLAKANVSATVKFECLPGKLLRVIHGRRKAEYKAMPEIMGYDSPSIKDAKPVTVSKNFRALISTAGAFVSDDKEDDHIRWAYLTGTHVLANNKAGVIKMLCKSTYVGPIDPKFITFLRNPEDDQIQVTKRGLVVKFPSGYIFQSQNAAVAERFPHEAINASMRKLAQNPILFVVPSAYKWQQALSMFKSVSLTTAEPILIVSGNKGDTKVKLRMLTASVNFSETIDVEPLKSDVEEHLRLLPLLATSPAKDDTITLRCTPTSNYYVGYGKVHVGISRLALKKA